MLLSLSLAQGLGSAICAYPLPNPGGPGSPQQVIFNSSYQGFWVRNRSTEGMQQCAGV